MSPNRTGERIAGTSLRGPWSTLIQPVGAVRRPARGVMIVAVALLAAACGASGGADRGLDEPPSGASAPSAPSPLPAQSPSPAGTGGGCGRRGVEGSDRDRLGAACWRAATGDDLRDPGLDGHRRGHHEPGSQDLRRGNRRPADGLQYVTDRRFRDRNDDPHLHFVTTTSKLVAELTDGSVVPGVDLERPGAPPSSTVEGRYAFEVPAETRSTTSSSGSEDPGREPRSTCRLVECARAPKRTGRRNRQVDGDRPARDRHAMDRQRPDHGP